MHGPMKVKSPNNISKWQMGFNSAVKGLIDNCGLQATNAGHMCKFHKRKEKKKKNGTTYIKVEVVYLFISALRITNPLCTFYVQPLNPYGV